MIVTKIVVLVVGFPANDFLWQEPGSDKEIANFCEKNYGVTFPMMSKISVKGSGMHPLYQFLTQFGKNGYKSSSVSWNFQKILIGTDGKLKKIITPRTAPLSEEVLDWIEQDVMALMNVYETRPLALAPIPTTWNWVAVV